MTTDQLCQWLRENSSGIYRPARDAADLIDGLTREKAALVEALKGMRDKLYSVAERHNDRSCDYDVCKEVRDCDAALRAAGVATEGGLGEAL